LIGPLEWTHLMEEEKREKTGNREWVSMSRERERERGGKRYADRQLHRRNCFEQAADQLDDSAENPTARYRSRGGHVRATYIYYTCNIYRVTPQNTMEITSSAGPNYHFNDRQFNDINCMLILQYAFENAPSERGTPQWNDAE